ncbi:N-acetylmuramoyl-L-alanine amidase [Clostridium chromiireducens]|uniref:Sporulation-specific N-acetylmuramoyl-L-alanine amidase n=1 Tax=Clostridium chromiireducens TaxID=225345 RepID=A0A1V4ID75_9CLOT|nr:N-acetylmuramoyl-L-alanine amidase [Clostridium chromiireducens]OPJ57893.1 sporulation-specific N-acetylmuramoyl-L-alanine amidase [Clostridium chromiireducens]
MKKFIIAVGHTASRNIGCGVIDRLDESSCNREIGTLLAEYLKEKGYGVNLLRIDKSNSYTFEDCYIRANEANGIAKHSEVDIYVEIHINAGGGTGPEVCVTGKSEVANQYSAKICNSLSSELNLPNRGVKKRSLIVLNNTVMPAILVECLFADSNDAEVYNPEVIASAIVNGLIRVDNTNDGEWKLGWNRNDAGWWYCNDIKNKYYYTSQNGWKEIDGEWYIFDSRGYALQNSWYYNEEIKSWYYLDSNCKMVRGSKEKPLWIWIDNGCYAFNEYGQMYCDCFTPDGYRVDKNGEWLKI